MVFPSVRSRMAALRPGAGLRMERLLPDNQIGKLVSAECAAPASALMRRCRPSRRRSTSQIPRPDTSHVASMTHSSTHPASHFLPPQQGNLRSIVRRRGSVRTASCRHHHRDRPRPAPAPRHQQCHTCLRHRPFKANSVCNTNAKSAHAEFAQCCCSFAAGHGAFCTCAGANCVEPQKNNGSAVIKMYFSAASWCATNIAVSLLDRKSVV